MKKSSRTWSRKDPSFTLIELLVVIAIIAILASMLMPALSKARESANRTNCMGNIRQLSLVVFSYVNDFKDYFPIQANNTNTLKTKMGDSFSWIARVTLAGYINPGPSDPTTRNRAKFLWCKLGMKATQYAGWPYNNDISYGLNNYIVYQDIPRKMRDVRIPGIAVLLGETNTNSNNETFGHVQLRETKLSSRHNFVNPWTMMDGSTKMVKTRRMILNPTYYDFRYYAPFNFEATNPALWRKID